MPRHVPGRTHFNTEWQIAQNEDGTVPNNDALLAVMMGIRAELQKLNRTLNCPNFLDIPHKLERIRKNTTKKRKPKVATRPRLRAVS